MKKLFVIILLLVSIQVVAQTYPITNITISLPSSPDSHIANWAKRKANFIISASALQANGKMAPEVVESRLLIFITKDGSTICGSYSPESAPEANFTTTDKQWKGDDAVSLLGQGCDLQQGQYELNVQFFGDQNGKIVALSEQKIITFFIGSSGKAGVPQQAIDVEPGAKLPDVKRSDNQANETKTQEKVAQEKQQDETKRDGQQPVAADSANKPQQKPTQEKKPGFLARVGKLVVSTTATSTTVTIDLSSKSGDCEWGPLIFNHALKFDCGSKEIIAANCGVPFEFVSSYGCTSKDGDCNVTTSWEITKDGGSVASGKGDKNVTGGLTPKINGNYILTLSGACNGKKAKQCVYTIAVTCETCDCGTWSAVQINGRAKYDCGYKNPIPWQCNQPLNFTSTYKCNSAGQGCQATTNWEITKDGVSIKTGEGNNDVSGGFTPVANGTYTITLTAACNGVKCPPPCIYTIIVTDCKTCDCGAWTSLAVNNAVKYESGNQNSIPWKCGKSFSFTSGYRCAQSIQGCQAATTWQIDKDGVIIKTGSGITDAADAFTPIANGIYTITLSATCNDKKCVPAVYRVIVEDCATCDCGSWVDPVVNIQAAGRIVAGLKCGESVKLTKGNYSMAVPDFRCSAATATCPVSYAWSIQHGTIMANGTGQTINCNFSQAGVYTIEITPMCGGKKCQPCKLQVIVPNDIIPPGAEKTNPKSREVTQPVFYYVVRPEYSGEIVYTKDTLFLQLDNNYSAGSSQLFYTIRNLSNDRTSKQAKLPVVNNQGLIRVALPLQNSVVQKGEAGVLIIGDYKRYYYISFKRN